MKISILIPVYNTESYLDECISSIICQAVENIEVILVDDGSTDNSGKICDDYSKKFDFIKVIHKKNEGLISARRIGLQSANGEYIMFLDSDDFISKDAISILLKSIEDTNADIIIYGIYKYNNGNIKEHKPNDLKKNAFIEKKEIYEHILAKTISNGLCSKLIKKECIDVNKDYSKYYKNNLGEDLLQLLPILEQAKTVFNLEKALYYYRTNPNSLTQKYNTNNYNCVKVVNKLLDQYTLKWEVECIEEKLKNRFFMDISDLIKMISKASSKCNKKEQLKIIRNDLYFKDKLKNYDLSKSKEIKKVDKIFVSLLIKRKYIFLIIIMNIYKYYIFVKNK